MKLLLVVGTANDIFIGNMVKWLKASIDDLTIDVYQLYERKKQGDWTMYYKEVHTTPSNPLEKMKVIGNVLFPFYAARDLDRFLQDRHYDIIQCHWIMPFVVLSTQLKRHCRNLCYMFWGGEFEEMAICRSHKLYLRYLKRSLKQVDYVVNGKSFIKQFKEKYPDLKMNFHTARLGAIALDNLFGLIEKESKEDSKNYWGIPSNKRSVLIGYSGKRLHNHIAVIEELAKSDDLKSEVHILAPMTRGAGAEYIMQVENALKESGYSYTLLKNRFLSDYEIASVRNATDIVLQMSDFDGYSRSLIECMSASATMIYGQWLAYDDVLREDGFEAVKVKDIAGGIDALKQVVSDYPYYYEKAVKNSVNGKKYMWQECIKGWVDFYRGIC